MPNRNRASVDRDRDARLSVAHVNVARGFRGGERQTELLIRQLEARGVEQVLVARRRGALARRLADTNVDIREVGGGPVATCCSTRGADVVHVHEGRSIYGAYLRALIAGTPYIATRRVDNPIGDHFFAHRAYRRAARVVAISPQVAEIVRRYDPSIAVTTVPSSSSRLASEPTCVTRIRSELPGRVVVGHVGALDNQQKGQEFIIEVASRFRMTHPEVCFVLVGGGKDEAMLRRTAADLDNLIFTGFVDNVGDYLAAFDVFVFPSRYEGLGSILLDAMDFGLPIVATRVGGVPSIVRDGENGLLVESGNAAALANAVEQLVEFPGRRRRMGEAGRRISRDFAPEVMCEKYLAIYDAVTARGARDG